MSTTATFIGLEPSRMDAWRGIASDLRPAPLVAPSSLVVRRHPRSPNNAITAPVAANRPEIRNASWKPLVRAACIACALLEAA